MEIRAYGFGNLGFVDLGFGKQGWDFGFNGFGSGRGSVGRLGSEVESGFGFEDSDRRFLKFGCMVRRVGLRL